MRAASATIEPSYGTYPIPSAQNFSAPSFPNKSLFGQGYAYAEKHILEQLAEVIQDSNNREEPYRSIAEFVEQALRPLLTKEEPLLFTKEEDPHGHLAHYYALEQM